VSVEDIDVLTVRRVEVSGVGRHDRKKKRKEVKKSSTEIPTKIILKTTPTPQKN